MKMAGGARELYAAAPKNIHYRLIVCLAAREGFVIQDGRVKIVLPGSRQAISVRFVAQHDRDLSIERARFDSVNDGLKIGAVA